MLINSLGLKNFKCFEELNVKFAPITLLTGANSSGKSSLINAILAVLQTEQFPFYLSPNGKYVNMGSFEEIILKGNKKVDFTISVNYEDRLFFKKEGESSSFNIKTKWKYNKRNGLPVLSELSFNSRFSKFDIYKKGTKYFINFDSLGRTIYVDSDEDIIDTLSKFVKFDKVSIIKDKSRSENMDTSYSLVKIKFKNALIYSIDEFIRVISNPRYEQFSALLSEATESISYTEILFNYLGSFRQPPERTYYQKAKSEKVGPSGEGYIDQIIEWEETELEKFNNLSSHASDIQLLSKIQANKIGGGRFELGIKAHANGNVAALTDVGFGISQFLPIIVADLQLSNESCLAISQPEIHLHPKIQAQFGNYLANQIKQTQKQYIVETHSEYLLNRIRLLLVTGELKPEDVRVLYFENDGVKSTVHDVEFATDGQIKGAPQGFFDTYGIDVMNIAMNAVQ